MRNALLVLTLIAVAAEAGEASAQGLDRARRYYDAALAELDAPRRIALLERSFEERETYEAAIALGEDWLRAEDAVRARSWLDTAYALCGPDEACARALFRIGESYRLEGELGRYGQYLKWSLAHQETATVKRAFRALMEERQARTVSADQIVTALTPDDTIRSATVRTTIDLAINFEFDSDRLTSTGREQARELGLALERRRADILLVGHTDEVGTREYNAGLSIRRAEAVRRFLVDEFDLDARNISVQGRGEEQLLLDEPTDAAHAINRRVEVVGH